ncbi:hypothetical protein Q7I66_22930 [Escherichia coli]|uniref:hypothetical protein n=1 Tax=Escherichia coli TaxID=562 RepID=UPI003EE71155
MLKKDGKRKKIVVIEKANCLDCEQLSERIVVKIKETEALIECPIGELDFQYIVMNEAKAYTIRKKKKALYFKGLTHDFEGGEKAEWTRNLRDALIFDDERKAAMMIRIITFPRMNYEIVPLIYKVDPLFKSEK